MEEREKRLNLWDDALTIPNALSLLRLLLIPVIVVLYTRGERAWALVVLLLSGLTDTVDGYIARHFNMVSDLGKILDPVADKFTQAATLLCLVAEYPRLLALFVMLAVKELSLGIFGLIVIRKTGNVKCANWHGKLTTFMLYMTMAIHIIWPGIRNELSTGLIAATFAVMLLSFVLYILRNIRQLKSRE